MRLNKVGEQMENTFNNLAEETLTHHGVLGMKWGIRRYQPYPKDYHGDGRFVGKEGKSRAKTSYVRKARESLPRISDMSDQELDALLNRLNKERNLYNMAKESDNKRLDSIKDYMKVIAATAGTTVALAKLSNDQNVQKIVGKIAAVFKK